MYNLYLEEKRKKEKDVMNKKKLEMQRYKTKFNSKQKPIKSFF
jgi:hypothetical protein